MTSAPPETATAVPLSDRTLAEVVEPWADSRGLLR
jgi:hypothetical protein